MEEACDTRAKHCSIAEMHQVLTNQPKLMEIPKVLLRLEFRIRKRTRTRRKKVSLMRLLKRNSSMDLEKNQSIAAGNNIQSMEELVDED